MSPILNNIIQILAAFAGTLGYGALFNVRGKKLLLAALGGMLGWIVYLLLGLEIEGETIRSFIVALVTSAYSEVLARKLKTPASTFYIPTLMPLIPGSVLYYSIDAAVNSNLQLFLHHLSRTVAISAALSAGIILVNMMVRNIIKPYKNKK